LAYAKALTLVHPARTQPDQTPVFYGIPAWEDVSFLTPEGLELRGWFIPPEAAVDGAVIVFVHGLGSNREDLLDQAALLHKYGYGALLFDLRNSGESQGTITTLGYLEAGDVRAAVDYLLSRPDVNPQRIGLLGMSMGGATVLRAAARIPEVRAVVAEAAYTSIEDNLAHGVRALTGLPPFPFAPLVAWFGELQSGLDIRLVRPIDDVGKIAPRPLLLVHGDQDALVPAENAQALYQAAGEPKQVYIVRGAGHGGYLDADPSGFERTLVDFFQKYLLAP
jgi:pimeloyl-ACP methyl ester carboxylesterase